MFSFKIQEEAENSEEKELEKSNLPMQANETDNEIKKETFEKNSFKSSVKSGRLKGAVRKVQARKVSQILCIQKLYCSSNFL